MYCLMFILTVIGNHINNSNRQVIYIYIYSLLLEYSLLIDICQHKICRSSNISKNKMPELTYFQFGLVYKGINEYILSVLGHASHYNTYIFQMFLEYKRNFCIVFDLIFQFCKSTATDENTVVFLEVKYLLGKLQNFVYIFRINSMYFSS